MVSRIGRAFNLTCNIELTYIIQAGLQYDFSTNFL